MDVFQRPLAYWFILVFLLISLFLLLIGQTLAIIDYDLVVQMGLQEDIKDIGAFGVQMNRAFAVADSLIYIPLIGASILGLILNKPWAILTTAAVMGISAYWSLTIGFMFAFLENTPGYFLQPGVAYWVVLSLYACIGCWGLLYLIFRGNRLLA